MERPTQSILPRPTTQQKMDEIWLELLFLIYIFFRIKPMIMRFKRVIIAVLRSLTLQVYAGSRRDNARRCLSLSCMITGSRRSAVSDSGTVSAHPATFQHECYKSQQSLAATAESCLLSAESVWRFHPFQQISAAALWHIRTALQKDQDFFSSDQHLASNQQRGSVCSAKISRLLAFLKLSSESSPLL